MPRNLPVPQTTGEIPLLSPCAAFVYYAYDHAGDLLYVGVTGDLARRLENHRWGKSPWLHEAIRITWEQYANRQTAERVEKRQIRALLPKYNIAQNGRRQAAADMGLRFLPSPEA